MLYLLLCVDDAAGAGNTGAGGGDSAGADDTASGTSRVFFWSGVLLGVQGCWWLDLLW